MSPSTQSAWSADVTSCPLCAEPAPPLWPDEHPGHLAWVCWYCLLLMAVSA